MTTIMPIEQISDWQERLRRQDAFWQREIIDRPVVIMTCPKPVPARPWPPARQWAGMRDRWMDAEYNAECALAGVMNTDFLGDSLPTACPNLGPEVFSGFFGTQLEYGEQTSWSIPNLEDWSKVDALQFSMDNVYWRKLMELTDVLLEVGRNRFFTGITDLHPGADAIAAFRDPLNLNIDMIEHQQEVKALVDRVTDVFGVVYDAFANKLQAAGQAITCWPGIVSSRRWYVPSNDFSCMISKQMFDETFLPGITRECQHLEASIYHLDGPGALRHLDSLLEIPELNAIQWVFGEGNGPASKWMHVYQRCQQAGKGLQIGISVDELDYFMQNLRPEGVWLSLQGIRSREHADALLRKISGWTARQG
jgi:hypothetical protein